MIETWIKKMLLITTDKTLQGETKGVGIINAQIVLSNIGEVMTGILNVRYVKEQL